MILDTIRETPHWYTQHGQSMHDADLRKARKMNLLPSVTSILNMWPKGFGLENYKMESAILAALTLPKKDNEPEDAFAKRVIEDMHEHREKSAAFGKRFHNLCDMIAASKDIGPLLEADPALMPYAGFFQSWFNKNIIKVYSTETVAVSKQFGYAGTYDLIADTHDYGVAKFDFKTQEVKAKGPVFYENWGFQLTAYKRAVDETMPGFIQSRVSVIMDSGKPCPPAIKAWEPRYEDHEFECFLACLNMWRLSKNFPYHRL